MHDSTKKNQMRQFYQCLKERPKTTAMAANELGIMRANLTRYVAYFERLGIITTVEKKQCEFTRHSAKYYSTEKKYRTPSSQPELFPRPKTKTASGIQR